MSEKERREDRGGVCERGERAEEVCVREWREDRGVCVCERREGEREMWGRIGKEEKRKRRGV